MKIRLTIGVLFISIFFILLPEPSNKKESEQITETESAKPSHSFVIREVRVYNGESLIELTDILIKNNLIENIQKNIKNPEQYPEINGKGKTLIPGLIDSHTHVWGTALTEALNFGVTTELDMFSSPKTTNAHQKNRSEVSHTTSADLFSSTILATAPNGHGTEYGIKIPVLTDVSEVEGFVLDRISEGADYIKAVYNAADSKLQFYPSISREILKALITSAHHNHKLLVVHIDNLLSAKHAIEDGADGIIHSFMDQIIDDELVNLMKKNKAFMIPTLSVSSALVGKNETNNLINDVHLKDYLSPSQKAQLKARFPDFGIPKSAYLNAAKSVKKLSLAGITILAGSDAPNPGTSHGISLHGELELLVDAGLTNEQAMHSATGAVRSIFPIGSRGRIEQGALATMILLDGNPFTNISDSKKINAIWKNGTLVKRINYPPSSQSSNQLSETVVAGMISDFNLGTLKTRFGAGISATADHYAGGKSISSITIDSEDNNSFLRVTGEIKTGFPYPWSGLAFIPGKSYSEAANLSQLKTLIFDAKSVKNINELSIILFQQGSFQPSTQKITLSDSWKTYRIDLSKYTNTDLSIISNISFVNTLSSGEFTFIFDNLKVE
ncbi:MAG: hypothetical protein COA74_15720 [Gammaproteobacteria bacterium]|nr:MAG: hypothetical protein COA74_15720 [Gammaproteobacteria bacterium]